MKTTLRTLVVLLLTVGWSVAPAIAQDDASVDPMPELLTELGRIEARIGYLQLRFENSVGEDRDLFADQLARRWREHHALLGEMVDATEAAREGGEERADATARIRVALERESDFIRAHVEDVEAKIAELRIAGPEAAPKDLLAIEVQLTELNVDLDELIEAAVDDIEAAEVVGADLGPDVALLDRRLEDRAATIAARIELALDQRDALVDRARTAGADTVAIQQTLFGLDEKLRGTTLSLQAMTDLLRRRDLETADYRPLLLEATGDIGVSILDPEVVGSLVATRWTSIRLWLADNAPNLMVKIVTILLVIFVFGILARLARKAIDKAVSSGKVDTSEILRRLLVGMASKVVWLLGFLVVLSVFGVDVGPMLAGLGIAGFVLGFALQDTLSNFAAGLMIMFYRPFDVGDVVGAAGVKGKVASVSLVSTVITTLDNQVLILPNSKVWGDVINNVTAQDTRRVDLVFGIGYGDDAAKAQRIMEQVLAEHPLVLDDPEAVVRLHELADSSVNFVCRPWCLTGDYWDVYWDVTETVKQRFDAEGVSIPFPQRDVHIYRQGAGDGAPAN
ncbi:MAG: mechanosensitive ion channel [Gemmatimonadetes bacterium]|nr:mechanosensitive ion channel [Gemmatimonadota bacterium]